MKLVQIIRSFGLILTLGLWLVSEVAWAKTSGSRSAHKSERVKAEATANSLPKAGVTVYKPSFQQLGAQRAIELWGIDGSDTLGFGVRMDQAVVSAKLNLVVDLSPALLPSLSHLKVYFNDHLVRTVLVEKDSPGTTLKTSIPLDPELFLQYNKLRFQLIGHYTLECEMPRHSSLWANISNSSTLELGLQPLALKDDLGMLPLPFFDARETGRVAMDFVFPEYVAPDILQAAATVAQWFGVQTSYRGLKYTAHRNKLPASNAVVFATNQSRPAAFANLPPVDRPTIRLIAHPDNPAFKLLLIAGADGQQLKTAADALALKHVAMSGPIVVVDELKYPERRKAYDSPRWAKTDRPLQFAELVSGPQALQLQGVPLNQTVYARMRLPPDMFTWNQADMLARLKYRYTPNQVSDHGMVSLAINQQFVRSQPLLSTKDATKEKLGALFQDGSVQATWDVRLPNFLVGEENLVELRFNIPNEDSGRCRTVDSHDLKASVDPSSTIDLSTIGHYIRMPNMAAYANSGYPFSRYADLAETVVVVSEKPTDAEVSAILMAVGHLGIKTGLPATAFRIITAAQLSQYPDRDVLIVAKGDPSGILKSWGQDAPAVIEVSRRSVEPISRMNWPFFEYLQNMFRSEAQKPENAKAVFQGQGGLGILMGFESPLKGGRSVVGMTGTDDEALLTVVNGIHDPAIVAQLRGDIVVFRGGNVESFRSPNSYWLGDIWWWSRLWFHLNEHPALLAIVGLFLGLVLALLVYFSLQYLAKRRLESGVE